MSRRSRSLGFWFLVWASLCWFSLRPAPALETALERGLAPLRVLSELGSPFVWLERGVFAAGGDGAALALVGSARSSALRAELARLAEPARAELRGGRHLVPAEVVDRPRGERDRLLAQLSSDARGIRPGDPVVSGDAYVGRVAAVEDFARGLVTIDLVTGAGFFVGGRTSSGATGATAGGEALRMTVGGLIGSRGRRQLRGAALAVHHPSSRDLPVGTAVEVDDYLAGAAGSDALARGFALGTVRRSAKGELSLEPVLDFQDGLYHVTILCPAERGRGAEAPPRDPLSDGHWLRVRPLSTGDAQRARSGLEIAAGSDLGVEPGAVVWSRGRMIGRVGRARAWSAAVRLLDDPGLSLVAVARVQGEDRPRALGRLVSLGRSGDGAAEFHWARASAARLTGACAAELYTGSGEAGLPSGLALGPAELSSADTVRLVARDGQPLLAWDADDLWVRLAPPPSPPAGASAGGIDRGSPP